MITFSLAYVTVTMATLLYQPHMVALIQARPVLFVFPVAALLAVANIPREIFHGREFRAFLSSSFAIVFLMALVGPGAVSDAAALDAGRRAQPHDLQRRVIGEDARHHARHRHDRRAGRPTYTTVIYWIFRGK